MEIFLVSAAAILCCALTVVFSRRYVIKAFNSLDAILDRILSKGAQMYKAEGSAHATCRRTSEHDLLNETTGEDRLSKLTHKARRILAMCVSEVRQTKEEKETIQGFISDMSHQMKTPLSGISMYVDLLLEGNLTVEEQREFLSRVKSGTEKLQWMMDSLIKMSRLEAGAIRLTPVSQNIKPTVADAICSVIAEAAKKNINIVVSDFQDTPLYHDQRWMREAIANVLENAVKYSAPDSDVKVSVESLPLYTKITITDHGIGVEKNDWHLIFKRFYRGQNATANEGAGLGLYLAALIMEKQGGYIMVDSVPGDFTSFSLFLQNCKK